jgi:hypothetical protein
MRARLEQVRLWVEEERKRARTNTDCTDLHGKAPLNQQQSARVSVKRDICRNSVDQSRPPQSSASLNSLVAFVIPVA